MAPSLTETIEANYKHVKQVALGFVDCEMERIKCDAHLSYLSKE